MKPCRFRPPPTPEGRYHCASPLLVVAKEGVTEAMCESCPVVDREAPPLPVRPPPPQPSAKDMALRFLSAIAHELAWRAKGGRPPTEEEKNYRRRICDGCSFLDREQDCCTVCGCFLERHLLRVPPILLGKLDCSSQACPKGFWGTVGGAKQAGCS